MNHTSPVPSTWFQGIGKFVYMKNETALSLPTALTNASSVFLRLMQRVVINPMEGPDFVSVYIDDVLVFSRTVDEHLDHLVRVIERRQVAGLKLKPSKCFFLCQEFEYLGHRIMPRALDYASKD